MKVCRILLLTFLAMPVFADRLRIPQLQDAVYADAEVSTNIVLSPLEGSRKFTAEISLYADLTNNVEVSVGSDAIPADMRLSAGETAYTVGWKRGVWFFSSPGGTNLHESAASVTGSVRTLSLQIDIRENDTIRNIALSEDCVPVFTNAVEAVSPTAGVWNLLKVTRRGPMATAESIAVQTNPYGVVIIFR